MTHLLTAPSTPETADAGPWQDRGRLPPLHRIRRTAAAAGVRAGLESASVGLAAVVAVTLVLRSGEGGLEPALRTGTAIWLLAAGGDVTVAGSLVTMLPLGLTAGLAVLLWRRSSAAVRRSGASAPRPVAALVAALVGTYALLAAALASASASDLVRPSVSGALLGGAALTLVAGGGAALWRSGLAGSVAEALPARVRSLVLAGVAAVVVLLAAGALLAAVALAVATGSAAETGRLVASDWRGGAGLLVIGLVLVPNAAVWGAAFAAGPGFSAGAGSVSPFGADVGSLPALPLLVALPTGPGVAAPFLLASIGAVLAGLVAGSVVVRRLPPLTRELAVVWGLLCGPCAGLLAAGTAALAGGAAGPGRLAEMGPSPWRVAAAVTAEVALAAAASAWWTARSATA